MSDKKKTAFVRLLVLGAGLALFVSGAVPLVKHVYAAATAKVELDVTKAGPREVEDSTRNAIVRDYTQAWQVMAAALANNTEGPLGQAFVGIARDKLAERVAAQAKSGLRARIVDKGHALQAVFYSPEGSAMQLHDVAKYELQLLDGDDVVFSQEVQEKYIALMTVAEGRWKVRVLEQVADF